MSTVPNQDIIALEVLTETFREAEKRNQAAFDEFRKTASESRRLSIEVDQIRARIAATIDCPEEPFLCGRTKGHICVVPGGYHLSRFRAAHKILKETA